MTKRDWRCLTLFAASLIVTEVTSAFIGRAPWVLPVAVSMFVFTATVMAYWPGGAR